MGERRSKMIKKETFMTYISQKSNIQKKFP